MNPIQTLLIVLAVGAGTTITLANGLGVPAASNDESIFAGLFVAYISYLIIRGINAIYGWLERRRGEVPAKRNSVLVSAILTVAGVTASLYLWWYADYALALVTAILILVLGLWMVYVDFRQSRR